MVSYELLVVLVNWRRILILLQLLVVMNEAFYSLNIAIINTTIVLHHPCFLQLTERSKNVSIFVNKVKVITLRKVFITIKQNGPFRRQKMSR